jgi:hypothetical protein
MKSAQSLAVLISLLLGSAAIACGGQPAEAKSPAPSNDEPGAPNVPWAQKTRAQRQDYMGLVVFPTMKNVFQKFDPKGFADFKCQTCHGDNMKEVDFKMPNSLYALPAHDTWQAALDYDADTAKFMGEQVLPKMTELLDQKPFDPQTGKGFRCLNCHPTE